MKAIYNIKQIIIFLLVLIILPSCGSDDKSKANKVNKLEILAIKVNKPQAYAGDEITAEALVGHPEGYDKEYSKIWLSCVGNKESCLVGDGITGLPSINSDTFKFKIPENIIPEGEESQSVFFLFILCESDIETCQNEMMSEDGEGLNNKFLKVSYKTVEVIRDDSPIVNHNPKIKSIYLNGTELTSDNITLKADKDDKDNRDDNIFTAEVTSSSFDEVENLKDKDKVDYESIVFAWKSTLGDIEHYYTDQEHDETIDDLDENPFRTAKDSESDTYKIYVIALDYRGGTDWRILNVTSEK